MIIYVSGVHSGPNPSPGIGTARAIKEALPEAILIAVDYSASSSGIHHELFDDVLLMPSWEQIDFESYITHLHKILLPQESIWVSGLDLEVKWMSESITLNNILVPPQSALKLVRKPTISIVNDLPFKIPNHISLCDSDWNIHNFCRKNNWRIWLKSKHYEAVRVRSWLEFMQARRTMASTWPLDDLFLQAHIDGHEESIALCAIKGKLLSTVHMKKRAITSDGKTWAGSISEVPSNLINVLEKTISELNWTGGAELEFIRGNDNYLYLIDWNPRFPAWIYGATYSGFNLPAELVSAFLGCKLEKSSNKKYTEFCRIVLEIPVRREFPPPPMKYRLQQTELNWLSKHPSGMHVLSKRLHHAVAGKHITEAVAIPDILQHELKNYINFEIKTPSRIFLGSTFERDLKLLVDQLNSIKPIPIRLAYSVKTNPSQLVMQKALEAGCLAETISWSEANYAMCTGYKNSDIILNGPGKSWAYGHASNCNILCIHADSLEELKKSILTGAYRNANYVGIRLRPPFLKSRFGISIEDINTYKNLIALLKLIKHNKLSVHFHLASSSVGPTRWQQILESMLVWAHNIESDSGVGISCIDIGGGWFPDDWMTNFIPNTQSLSLFIKDKLPSVHEIICEPGKALVQPYGVTLMRILEIRQLTERRKDIVVDGAISDIPEASNYPHRIAVIDDLLRLHFLDKGSDRILGRICMESDILSDSVDIPEFCHEGNLLAFFDTGAYDWSMSYAFGKGL